MRDAGPIAICVINLKGGVGKSTISALLARYAYRDRQADVLAIDLDPQANLSQALMGANYNSYLERRDPSVVELFAGYQPPTKGKKTPGTLTPASLVQSVAEVDEDWKLDLIPSRFDFSDALTGAVRPDPRVLARFLAENYSRKDLIIIDCAPTESILTQAAYHASGLILIPVKPEFFATVGFPLLQESLSLFKTKNKGQSLSVAGVVVNNGFYHGGNNGGPEKEKAMRGIRAECKANGWKIYRKELPFSRGFPKLMRGDYAHLGNANEFGTFAKELFDDIGL